MLLATGVLVSGFLIPTGARAATTLLIQQTAPYLGYGYGLADWDLMTSALNGAFGAGNITVSAAPLNNLPYLMTFDRLWLTPPQPGSSLTAGEISNLQAYIATGRRVALIGENNAWTSWNNSILQPVGGTYSGVETSSLLTPAIVHPLTAGVASLNTIADGLAGVAVGGTSVFNQNVVTLWGGQQSVVSVLSINVIDDLFGSSADNPQFMQNLAQWLVAVPEPSSLSLFGFGVMAMMASRARKLQRKT